MTAVLTTRRNLQSIKRLIIVSLGMAFTSVVTILPAHALDPGPLQGDTIKAVIDTLEERHYARQRYDDALSSAHLDGYIDSLDPQRMFFSSDDLNYFEQWRSELDNTGRSGEVAPAFAIFNRYEAKLSARLEKIIADLPAMVAGFDYDRLEYIVLDGEDQPWADNEALLDDRWRKRVKNQALGLKLADKPADEIVPTLERRYKNQLSRLKQYNADDVFQVYANALSELYDPHTSYFSPRRAENFDINMSLSFDGIGAVLQVDDEYTKILRLVPAGPAEKQGELKPSDLIIGVGEGEDGEIEDVVGWRLDEVVDLIRGPKETIVRLEVIPSKSKTDERRVIAIQRNKVKLEEQSAQSEIIEIEGPDGKIRKIGVIDVPAFYIDFEALRRGDEDYKSTTRDVRKLIDDLQTEQIDGLVIDLRNNGGGSLQEANELTGLFIEYGPTVQIRSAERRVWRDGKRRRSPYYEGPVAVLMNRLSASASEIFAGAIQDYGRGIIVGDRSFGKGTVQTLIGMPEGQLKITESKFYRISGDSTQHRGVVPDISLPSLFDHEEIGESALANALDWDQISPVRHRDYDEYAQLIPRLKSNHEARTVTDPDFIFLLDQVALVEQARGLDRLPLAQSERIAMRDAQEQKTLAIENKRRTAKGLPLLDSLDDDASDDPSDPDHGETNVADTVASEGDSEVVTEQADTAAADDPNTVPDVLLIEAGHILADALSLSVRPPLSDAAVAATR